MSLGGTGWWLCFCICPGVHRLSWCQAGCGSAWLLLTDTKCRSGGYRAAGLAVRAVPAPASAVQWGHSSPQSLSRPVSGRVLWLQVPLTGASVDCPVRTWPLCAGGLGHVGVTATIQADPSGSSPSLWLSVASTPSQPTVSLPQIAPFSQPPPRGPSAALGFWWIPL